MAKLIQAEDVLAGDVIRENGTPVSVLDVVKINESMVQIVLKTGRVLTFKPKDKIGVEDFGGYDD